MRRLLAVPVAVVLSLVLVVATVVIANDSDLSSGVSAVLQGVCLFVAIMYTAVAIRYRRRLRQR